MMSLRLRERRTASTTRVAGWVGLSRKCALPSSRCSGSSRGNGRAEAGIADAEQADACGERATHGGSNWSHCSTSESAVDALRVLRAPHGTSGGSAVTNQCSRNHGSSAQLRSYPILTSISVLRESTLRSIAAVCRASLHAESQRRLSHCGPDLWCVEALTSRGYPGRPRCGQPDHRDARAHAQLQTSAPGKLPIARRFSIIVSPCAE